MLLRKRSPGGLMEHVKRPTITSGSHDRLLPQPWFTVNCYGIEVVLEEKEQLWKQDQAISM
jgi:hypothetical protein